MKSIRFSPIILSLVVSTVLVFTGCKDNATDTREADELRFFDLFMASEYPDMVPRESGLFVQVIEEGAGVYPDSGDWVSINYVITSIPSNTITKRVLDTYYEKVARENGIYSSGVLYGSFLYQSGIEIAGVREGLQTMREGGKSRLMFSSDLGHGSKGTSIVNPYTSLIYDIHLIEVIGDIIPYEEERIAAYLDTIPESKTTVIYDSATQATMYYIEDMAGTGYEIANDTTVEVYYVGSLPDERVFDSNIGGNAFQITVGAAQVIRGWDIGLTYFKRGGKGRLVIPYKLAYGEAGRTTSQGKTTIPPYATLIFEMEVLDDEAVTD